MTTETSDTPLDHEAAGTSPIDISDQAEAAAAASSSSEDRRRSSRVLVELNAIAHTLDSLNEVLVDILTLTAPPQPPSPPSKRRDGAISTSSMSSDAVAEEGGGHHGDPNPKNVTTGGEIGGTSAVAQRTIAEGTGDERSIAVKQHRLLMELKMWERVLGTQEDDDR